MKGITSLCDKKIQNNCCINFCVRFKYLKKVVGREGLYSVHPVLHPFRAVLRTVQICSRQICEPSTVQTILRHF